MIDMPQSKRAREAEEASLDELASVAGGESGVDFAARNRAPYNKDRDRETRAHWCLADYYCYTAWNRNNDNWTDVSCLADFMCVLLLNH